LKNSAKEPEDLNLQLPPSKGKLELIEKLRSVLSEGSGFELTLPERKKIQLLVNIVNLEDEAAYFLDEAYEFLQHCELLLKNKSTPTSDANELKESLKETKHRFSNVQDQINEIDEYVIQALQEYNTILSNLNETDVGRSEENE